MAERVHRVVCSNAGSPRAVGADPTRMLRTRLWRVLSILLSLVLSICAACAPAPGAREAAAPADGGAVPADSDPPRRVRTAAITGGEHDRSDCDGDTNDVPETATKLERPLDAFICPGDDDWYRVSAPTGARVRIAFRHAEGDLDLEARGLDGGVLARSEGVRDEEVVTASGLFVVRVYGYAGASNEYLIAQHPVSGP